MLSKNKFCEEINLEKQYFNILVNKGVFTAIKGKNGHFLIDIKESEKLLEGVNYVKCPECGKKMSEVTNKHYVVCCPEKGYSPLYCTLSLEGKSKTEEQKNAQSIKLLDRFKTLLGDETRKIITKRSRELNSDKDFLIRKSEISKEVQNRPDQKKKRSEKSLTMWRDLNHRLKNKEYVKENIEGLRKSAANARKYLSKTSKLHLLYKKSMLEESLLGFESEFIVGPYSIDEADPIAKIALEIDGCYWHGCDKCGFLGDSRIKAIDRRKESYLKNRGWYVIRILEHDIKKDKKTCIEVIRSLQEVRIKSNREKIRDSFLSGSLKVKSLLANGVVDWAPISDIVRHNTPHKKMLKVTTDKGSVCVTEDHSLFSWESKNPILTNELSVGDFIVSCDGYESTRAVVTSIEEVGREEHTFDVSVPGSECAFLSSGILVHNTYSVSGVSLDVEKSSKYQSMKENFISEYDKLKDQAKRSIKIAKGLKQPRFGIGISSSTGPYSRPGVQSRRNYVSGASGGWS